VVFRWTLPHVSYLPGEAVPELPGGTTVVVKE
jgi:hypothetical protein